MLLDTNTFLDDVILFRNSFQLLTDRRRRAPPVAMHVGDLVIVCNPRSTCEIHRNRIGKLVSISNWISVKFGAGDEIKFYGNELEIVTTPTAQSYAKNKIY